MKLAYRCVHIHCWNVIWRDGLSWRDNSFRLLPLLPTARLVHMAPSLPNLCRLYRHYCIDMIVIHMQIFVPSRFIFALAILKLCKIQFTAYNIYFDHINYIVNYLAKIFGLWTNSTSCSQSASNSQTRYNIFLCWC